jgi:hypothetical protein
MLKIIPTSPDARATEAWQLGAAGVPGAGSILEDMRVLGEFAGRPTRCVDLDALRADYSRMVLAAGLLRQARTLLRQTLTDESAESLIADVGEDKLEDWIDAAEQAMVITGRRLGAEDVR